MLSTLKNIATTMLAVLQTRLEVIGNELQVQKLVLARQLGLALALVFCVGLSVPLAIALAVATWWDQRVLVLGISTGLVVAVALWCYALLRNTLRSTEAVFAASLAALKDDMALLRASAGRSQNAPGGNAPND
jgi:uncharacterized membrane protein YqjE